MSQLGHLMSRAGPPEQRVAEDDQWFFQDSSGTFGSDPLGDLVSLLVGEGADDNHDQVDQRPDSEYTQGEQLEEARPIFPA
jgi:hypothetical protein